jgi:hypothetical protein
MSRPSCCGPRFSNLPPPHRDQAIDLTHVSVRLGNILTCAHAHDLRITCAFQATAARVVGPPRLGGSPHRTQAAMSLDAPVVKLRRRDSAALGGSIPPAFWGPQPHGGHSENFFTARSPRRTDRGVVRAETIHRGASAAKVQPKTAAAKSSDWTTRRTGRRFLAGRHCGTPPARRLSRCRLTPAAHRRAGTGHSQDFLVSYRVTFGSRHGPSEPISFTASSGPQLPDG